MNDPSQFFASETPPPMAAKMLFASLLAAIAGLMFGLDIGVISGALGFIQKQFNASITQLSWIVSSMTAGALIGALAAGWLSFHLGRRKALILSAILFVVGALYCAGSPTVMHLIYARAVLGVAIGVASFVAPIYISEVAEESRRGSLISTYQLMVTIGIFLAFISDAFLAYTGSWRWMLGIVAVPGAIFLIGAFFLPDTPRWLMLRGREKEALDILETLRSDGQRAKSEIKDIRTQLQQRSEQKGFGMLVANANFRRSVALGIVLQMIQQFTGINVVMYFAPRILQETGFGQDGQMWGTAVIGLVNLLATFIAISYVDRYGRRPLLLAGFGIMTVGMGALALILSGSLGSNDVLHYLAIGVILCFITGFAFSAGPLIWTLCAEIQPIRGRDFGVTCSTGANWATNWLVATTFLPMLAYFGSANTFWVYGVLNLLFILFTMIYVPETKGVSLESIEQKLNSGVRLRDIGR